MALMLERRIALVTPFFGRDAAEADERFAFEFAAQLTLRGATLCVITTCARSAADDWSANYYRAGRDVSEAFAIERFRVEPRDRPAYGAALLALSSEAASPHAGDTYLREGVRSPGLLAHLRRVADAYDAFIFTPYNSATTLQALPFVAERAIVLPQLDADPVRFAYVIRERLMNARAFLLLDDAERDALLATLGSAIAPRCRVIGPLAGDPQHWDAAVAEINAVVDNLAALADGRSRARALAQVAYLYPVVRRQRSLIIAMQQSRFWQIRNTWFALKKKLGFKGEDVLPQIPPETAAAELSAVGDPYFLWRERNALRDGDIVRLTAVAAVLVVRPSFGIMLRVGDATAAELERTLRSLAGQIWRDWRAALIVSQKPNAATAAIAVAAVADDPRITLAADDEPAVVAASSATFVLPVDAGDLLEADTLLACALAANVHQELDVFYADEDEIDERGGFRLPRMKPDWSPESVLSRDYVGRPCMLRRAALERAGGLRAGLGGARWYDALLRMTDAPAVVVHEARVLYHGRAIGDNRAAHIRAAIADTLARRGETARIVELPAAGREHFAVRYALRGDERVSIIIPTRDRSDLLGACLESVMSRSTFADFDVLIVDNGSRESATQELLANWSRREPERFHVLRIDGPFNYSRLNNVAVAETTGEYVVFLNNDTVVLSEDWLEGLLEAASRPAIGAVGGLLLYPDDTVQHSGILLGILGLGGHAHRFASAGAPGHLGALQAPTNYSAVTAACMMVERRKFLGVGGFDESLAVSFNDVDLCLRLGAAGFRSVYLPYVQLYHFESKTRGGDDTPAKVRRAMEEIAFVRERWPVHARRDPFYNPNLTVDAEDFSLRI
jgi:GT2 family glycosyltransferase